MNITRIYSPINIPKIDNLLPYDIHTLIAKFCGFGKQIRLFMRFLYDSRISINIKKYILFNCQDNYDILDHISDDIINLKFLEMLLNNIENINDIANVIYLFYKNKNNNKFRDVINSDSEQLGEYLTNGYTITDNCECDEEIRAIDERLDSLYEINFEMIKADMYPAPVYITKNFIISNNKNLNKNFTKQQFALAFLCIKNMIFKFEKDEYGKSSLLFSISKRKRVKAPDLYKHCKKICHKLTNVNKKIVIDVDGVYEELFGNDNFW